MKKINENKNDKKTNATINKIFEEIEYAKEYICRWNASYTEKYSDVCSIDLYYTAQYKILEIEKLYHNQYSLLTPRDLYTRNEPALKRAVLEDEEGNIYACSFGKIEWNSTSSNKTFRNFTFANNGEITYSKEKYKNKTTKLDYKTKYNVNSNDLTITFYTDNEKIHIEFYDNNIYITYDDISIEINILTGTKKISLRKENLNHQIIISEIIIDKFNKILNKSIQVKYYDQDNQVSSTYNFSFEDDKLTEATYISKENQEYKMLKDEALTNIANNILSSLNISDTIFNLSIKEIEETIDKIKEKVDNLIRAIKGDIPLFELEKRLDIALSKINTKTKKEEEKNKTLKRTSKKHKNGR